MRLAVLASLAVAFLGSAAVYLIVSADPGGSCVKPSAILPASQQAAIAAVEKWVEVEVAPGWDVPKPGLVDAQILLTAHEEALAYKQGLNPAKLELEVMVVYDALKDPFFGGIISAERWKKYAVTVARDCADSEWRVVRSKQLDSGGEKGKDAPLPGSPGVPDAS